MLADMHVHTNISCDSKQTMEEYCISAISKSIDAICFTDHVDNNPADFGCGFYSPDAYFRQIEFCREKYGKELKILAGIEFSEPFEYQKKFCDLSKLPYDFIIGSVHFWKDDLFPSQMLGKNISLKDCFELYWDVLRKSVSFGGFDCVGHFDFPKRYYKDIHYNQEIIRDIMDVIVKNDLILEINTSSIRKGLNSTMPDVELLNLYKAAGGKYVTLGSDSHSVSELCADFSIAEDLVSHLGLVKVIYEKRKPYII